MLYTAIVYKVSTVSTIQGIVAAMIVIKIILEIFTICPGST